MSETEKNDEKKTSDTIVVNGRSRGWDEKEITFEQVVAIAYPNPPEGPDVDYTVSYRRGQGSKPVGTLKPNESVKVKDGMIFDVTPTDQS